MLNEAQLKDSVQNAIKKQCIDSKYKDESISFGQAVVTHHYFQQLQQNARGPTPQAMLDSIHQVDETLDSMPNQVVQFDLANSMSEDQMQQTFYGRRKLDNKWPNNLVPDVKEALKWDTPDEPEIGRARNLKQRSFGVRNQILMERSPTKWKTSYRDQYRKFTESPRKGLESAEGAEAMAAAAAAGEAQQFQMNQVQQNLAEAPPVGQQSQQTEFESQRDMQPVKGKSDIYGSQMASPKYNNDDLPLDSGAQNSTMNVNKQTAKSSTVGKHVVIQQDDSETKKKKKKQRPLTAEEKALRNKSNEINSTTRWLADSSFTTYFGKPAFHAYGKGNIKPANPAYKMLTHNINGCTGKQTAQFQQVYDSAYIKGLNQSKGLRVPQIPKLKTKITEQYTTDSAVDILPQTIAQQKQTMTKAVKKGGQVSIKISKPRLTINGFVVDKKKPEQRKRKASPARRPTQVFENKENYGLAANELNQDIPMEQIGDPDPKTEKDQQYEQAGSSPAAQDSGAMMEQHQNSQEFYTDAQAEMDMNHDTQENQINDEPDYENQLHGPECNCEYVGQDQLGLTQEQGKNPKNFAYLPSCFTRKIAPAGRITYQSESVFDVIRS